MAGLLRYQIFLSYGFLILGLWYTGIQNKALLLQSNNEEGGEGGLSVPILSSLPKSLQESIIDFFPIWMLFFLAIYAIGSIAYGVASFADCPAAAKEVERHVAEAKAEMKKRNIG